MSWKNSELISIEAKPLSKQKKYTAIGLLIIAEMVGGVYLDFDTEMIGSIMVATPIFFTIAPYLLKFSKLSLSFLATQASKR